MRKTLNVFGIILVSLMILTGCQKNDDEISLATNDENVLQGIDNEEEVLQILNNELPNLEAAANKTDNELKSTEDYICSLFRVNLEYSEDPNMKMVALRLYGNKDLEIEGYQLYTEFWLYKDGNWTLVQRKLVGGFLNGNDFLGRKLVSNWRTGQFVAAQILVFKYIDGQTPEYTGITNGIGINLK